MGVGWLLVSVRSLSGVETKLFVVGCLLFVELLAERGRSRVETSFCSHIPTSSRLFVELLAERGRSRVETRFWDDRNYRNKINLTTIAEVNKS